MPNPAAYAEMNYGELPDQADVEHMCLAWEAKGVLVGVDENGVKYYFISGAHNHNLNDLAEKSYNSLDDIPTEFPPGAHNHDTIYYRESEIDTKFADLLDGVGSNLNTLNKIAQAINHDANFYITINTALAGKSDVGHLHDDRYFTEAEVDARFQELINAAPAALDQLNEIADALNNDPDFAATMTTLLAGKSDIGHTHDDRYYTEDEVDDLLDDKADQGHGHALSEISDRQYSLLVNRPADDDFKNLPVNNTPAQTATFPFYNVEAMQYQRAPFSVIGGTGQGGGCGCNIIHVQYRKPKGHNGGTFCSGHKRTEPLNHIVSNNIIGAILINSQVTLPAGTYWIEGWAVASKVQGHRAFVVNVDTDDVLIESSSGYAQHYNDYVHIKGQLISAAETTIELQHQCHKSRSYDGFGKATNVSGEEIYADMSITQLILV